MSFQNTALRRADDPTWNAAWVRTLQKAFITSTCQHCEASFTYMPQPQQRRKYCSDECRAKANVKSARKARLSESEAAA